MTMMPIHTGAMVMTLMISFQVTNAAFAEVESKNASMIYQLLILMEIIVTYMMNSQSGAVAMIPMTLTQLNNAAYAEEKALVVKVKNNAKILVNLAISMETAAMSTLKNGVEAMIQPISQPWPNAASAVEDGEQNHYNKMVHPVIILKVSL